MELEQLVRKNILQMKAYSSARDEFTKTSQEMLFIDANENPFSSGYNRYPDPYARTLRAKLSEVKQIPEANIMLGNGSDELIDLLFRLFCEPQKDEVLVTPPTYGMYQVLAELNEVKLNKVPLNPKFQLETNAIIEAISPSTKMIFICSPNNPSGNLMSVQSIKSILNAFKGIVIIDEAYIDFAERSSFMGELNFYPNLVVIQTFSKAWAHAGIRLGMCFAQENIIQLLNKIKPPYNINQLTQEKALEVLEKASTYKNQVQMLVSEREILRSKLEKISWVEKIFPSDANFLLVKVDNANLRYQQLIDFGVVVRNRTNELHCENCLRLSVGTPDENIYLMDVINRLKL
jgi:histidinol-phosphate aminotransferase